MYKQIKSRYANLLAIILSIAIVFSLFSFPLVPTAWAADMLPAPQNVTVTAVTHKSITLTWEPVAGVDGDSGYQVWYSNGGWAAWTGATSATITGLNANTSYSFYVTAINAANNKSVVVTAKTAEVDSNAYPEPPLTTPHNLVISDITESTVKLSWTGSPGAAGYDMYVNNRWNAGIWNGSNTYIYPVPKTVTGSVYFEVAAQITPTNISARSNRVTINWGELSKPKDLKIVSATRSSVALGWAPTPGATGYDIYQGDSVIDSTYSNRYVATALTEGESYDFKVVAKNKLWQSPASNAVTAVPGSNYNIVTYYTAGARNPNERNYSVADVAKDIGASKLTHINYAFADLCWKETGSKGTKCNNLNIPLQDRYIYDGEMVIGDPTEDVINIADLHDLKAANPHLNLMISVGGWNWSKNFSNMANTEVNRRLFANSAVEFLREYGFDGLDIDWEYPVAGGEIDNSRRPEDKQNYTLLMKTVREALDAAGSEDGKYYLLTIASYQGDSFVQNADLANSSQYIDFINIMTYDYSGSWNTSGYHNAPLFYDPANPSASAKRNNLNGAAIGHLNGGVPNYKLVLGVPFFGNGWTGCQAKGEYVPCAEFAQFGTWENGKFDIYDLENNYLTDPDYVRYWNESAKVPYLYNQATGTFISYDDTESMMYKASLVKTLDLAGVMSWDITGDRNGTLSTQLVNDLPIHGVVNANALAAPQNVTSVSTTDTTLSVGWDAVAGATGYDVFADKVWQGYTTATEYVITKLTPSNEYTIEIIALEKDGVLMERVSAMSKPLKEMTNANVPSIDLQPVDHSVDVGDSVTLNVGASTSDSGTLSYQWYSSETDSSYTAISGATSASYEAPTTTVGTTYYYVVVTNTNGNKTSQATSSAVKVEVTAHYSVIFKDWDNTTLQSDPVNHGSVAIAPADPTRVGYTFSGWDAAFTNVTGDMTITAQYVVNKYTLSFESNGGSEVDAIEANYDSVLVEPAAPIKTGYRFEGWYKEAALTNKWSFATDKMPEGGTKLYANWSINGYTVTFKDWDNTTLQSDPVNHGSDAIAPANPTRVGYTFTGWDAAFTNITGDMTITAQYVVNQYTLSFESNGGSAVDAIKAIYDSVLIEPAAPTKTGYGFEGWYKEAAFTNKWNFATEKMPEGGTKLYANWTINDYTVTFKDWDNTTLKSDPVNHGSDAIAPANPTRVGYTFTGWDAAFTNVTGNMTITAQYVVNKYTLSFESNGGSEVDNIEASYDSVLVEPAAPIKTGYRFEGWYKEAALTNKWSFATDKMSVGGTKLYANWTINGYAVTFKDWDNTTLQSDPVNHGSDAIAPANPTRVGYTFTGWDAAFTNVTGDMTITAQYEVNQYTLSFESNGGSAVDAIEENYDSVLVEPAAPTKTGYGFDGWYKEAAFTNKWSFATDKMPVGGTKLYANWTINGYAVTFKDWDNTTLQSDPVNHGSDAIAPANPTRVGYTFTGWDAAFTNVTGDMTITAQYEVNQYTLSFESNGGSAVDAIEENYDSVLVEPAAPIKTGYRFEGWYKEAALTNKWSFATEKMPEGGTKLYANWTAVYSVTYHGNGSTGGSVPIDNTEYKTNEAVIVMDNINLLTKSGYRFVGWSTQPSGNGTSYAVSATLAINTDVTLYAVWDVIPSIPNIPNTTDTGMNILVNGKLVSIGTAITSIVNNKLVTIITLDQKELEERLKNEGSGAVITVPVSVKSDVFIFELSGQMVSSLQDILATIVVQTDNASYMLPTKQINIQQVAPQFGEETNILDIRLQIEVAESTAETLETVKYSAAQGNFTILVPPISFTVRAIYVDKSIELSKFNIYVERLIALPDDIDPNKVTTGVVVEQDGTVRHVPTKVILHDGKYYALINSMTNSTYSVVGHPLEFVDVNQHWAKAAINDMGSRMVISGIGNNMFNPDQDITRAEFAAVIVRGLGLPLASGATSFKDVKESDWYSSAVQTAYSNGLINGYHDGTFHPKEKITREQAMLIIANAMKLTGLKDKLAGALTDAILNPFKDASDVSDWAKSSVADNIQSEIVLGKNDARLVPKSNITRAEVAVMIQKLLQKSDLI